MSSLRQKTENELREIPEDFIGAESRGEWLKRVKNFRFLVLLATNVQNVLERAMENQRTRDGF